MERKPVLLFDFDGVIVDSFDISFHTAVELTPWLTEDDYRSRFEGNINHTPIDKKPLGGSNDEYFTLHLPKLAKKVPFPEMPKMLEDLAGRYMMVIISSTRTDGIDEFLVRHGLRGYFEEILGNDVAASKVEKINMTFAQYDCGPTDCLFITDTLGDIREARHAGVEAIAVTWGFHERERLEKGSPWGICEIPSELPTAIEGYFAQL